MLHRERWVRKKVSEIKESSPWQALQLGLHSRKSELSHIAKEILFPWLLWDASQTYGIPVPQDAEPDSNPSPPAKLFPEISARRAPQALCRTGWEGGLGCRGGRSGIQVSSSAKGKAVLYRNEW